MMLTKVRKGGEETRTRPGTLSKLFGDFQFSPRRERRTNKTCAVSSTAQTFNYRKDNEGEGEGGKISKSISEELELACLPPSRKISQLWDKFHMLQSLSVVRGPREWTTRLSPFASNPFKSSENYIKKFSSVAVY
jgi:hypothetical protein